MRGLDISVVLTTEGDGGLLGQSLAHLEVQSYPAGRFEVIVCCPDASNAQGQLERFTRGSPVPTRALTTTGPGWAHALGSGVEAARGRWVLFLDGDLFAGPALVESHVRSQEARGGQCAAVGSVRLHPHVGTNTFTKWEVLNDPESRLIGAERPWHMWHAWNLSLPRAAILKAGGINGSEASGAVADLELASRLALAGIEGYAALSDATAYGLRPTTLAHERIRHYRLGFATHALLSQVAQPHLREQILGPLPGASMAAARLEVPVWERIVASLGAETPRYRSLMRRILQYRAHQGYDDAAAGRAPRSFAAPTDLPAPLVPDPAAAPE